MIVAIDGPAGSGKSTIAKEIARQLGFNKLDTGAMYRAVTFAALDRGIDLDDETAIDALAEQIEIRFTNGTGEDTRLTIDGQDASAAIRTPQVDANVSKVSAYPGVRAAMLIHQRRAAEDRDIVAEGRDIGTVVFPNAQVKVFLTADPRERARRRVLQRHQNDAQTLTTEQLEAEVDETLDALKQRDKLDSSREVRRSCPPRTPCTSTPPPIPSTRSSALSRTSSTKGGSPCACLSRRPRIITTPPMPSSRRSSAAPSS